MAALSARCPLFHRKQTSDQRPPASEKGHERKSWHVRIASGRGAFPLADYKILRSTIEEIAFAATRLFIVALMQEYCHASAARRRRSGLGRIGIIVATYTIVVSIDWNAISSM